GPGAARAGGPARPGRRARRRHPQPARLTDPGAPSLRWSGTTALHLAPPKGDPLQLDDAMKPATALLILAVAWVANRLVRRAIRRLVASMSEDRGLAALRPPAALARTGEIPSLRRVQRAETVGALL